ncbi:FAD-binding protein [Streptosporangium nondiastaticum]|uniref:FAD-binding protein n=1 Tax=Streptosporangium nondiastaticum TaxID=35764 RepID=A0A9X7JV79_9ACTN|nr:FAD-binding protein [Streptosporangium nondiastaticum]PSJ30343.1 FAD-binding protein [Streptosporangium nondiastaticum]
MRNWAGNIDHGATPVARPGSVDALRRIVANNRRVRALGAGHSFSGILATTGGFVRLDGLPPAVDIDPAAATVTVTAGMRYTDVAAKLHRAGYALANLASLPDLTVAGATATGTHGSGDGRQSLAAAVTGLELVGPEGDLVRLRRDVDHDTFAGSVVSLGALGLVTRVTLEIEPSFQVAQSVHTQVPLDEVRDRFDEVLGAAYSVSVFTKWGHDATVWLKRRTDRPVVELELGTPARSPLHPVPGADPASCTAQLGEAGPWHLRLPHFRPGTVADVGDELQSEYFLPRSAARAAFDALRGIGGLIGPVLHVAEVRTVRGDDLWLSPAYERDSAAFHFTWVKDPARVLPVIAAVEELLVPLGARPHWAKLTAMTGAAIRSGYRRASDFDELRAKFDPDGKFGNAFVDELLRDGAP